MASEKSAKKVDGSAARDAVEVVLRGADGEVKQVVGREGLMAVADRIRATDQLNEQSVEDLKAEAEDMGIEITQDGKKKSNPSKRELVDVLSARTAPMGIGEVMFEGERHEVKGPGPEWERDSEGRYANR